MTDEQNFLTSLAGLAKACQFNLPADLIAFYDEGLRDLGYARVAGAVRQILINRRGNDRMPSIRDIRDLLEPSFTPASATQELLTRAIQAVVRFGYVDPCGAKDYMGEIAWRALPGNQGWEEFCRSGDESAGGLPIATARAQLRERIASQVQQEFPTGQIQLPPPGKATGATAIYLDAVKSERTREPLNVKDLLRIERSKT